MSKEKRRKRKSAAKVCEPLTLTAFVEQSNASTKGRSPSVLPFAEELLMRDLRQECARVEPKPVVPEVLPKLSEHGDQSISGCFELDDDVQTVYSFWRRNFTPQLKRPHSIFAIHLWLLPLIVASGCIIYYLSPSTSITTGGQISQSPAESSDTLFSREMESGAWFESLGDVEQAIKCYDRAAILVHDRGVDRERLTEAIEKLVKAKPLNPRIRIALGRSHEANGELDAAAREYRMALSLSPGKKNDVARKLLDSVVSRVSKKMTPSRKD